LDNALDARTPRFPSRFRGYDRRAVDQTIHELASRVASRTEECDELRRRLAEAERERDRLAGMEDAISRALVSAQRSAQEIADTARREAEEIVREARARGAKIVEEAEARADAAALQRTRFERELRDLMARVAAELEAQGAAPERGTDPAVAPVSPGTNGSTVTVTTARPAPTVDVYTTLRTGTDTAR
jgi:cell division initiation protein